MRVTLLADLCLMFFPWLHLCPHPSCLFFSLSFFCAICGILKAFSGLSLLCHGSDSPPLLSLTALFKNLPPKDSVFTHRFFPGNYHDLTNYDLEKRFWRQSHVAHAGLKNLCVNDENVHEFLILLLLAPSYMRVSAEYGFTYSFGLFLPLEFSAGCVNHGSSEEQSEVRYILL